MLVILAWCQEAPGLSIPSGDVVECIPEMLGSHAATVLSAEGWRYLLDEEPCEPLSVR